MQKRLFFIVSMFLFVVCATFAQVTTSSINGKVVAGGESVIGATVVAVHTPSGTRYTAATNEKGRYSIQGVRVGGPYTITISYIGYDDVVKQNVQLDLGEPFVLDAEMKENAQELGEVTVTGKQLNTGMGASSNFSTQDIANTPTVTRNIYDVAKMSPLVNENKFGGISIAGTNNRYNSFQIDGMVSNDVFGLAGTGTNGGQTGANPLSLDAIEQIQVVASPFDVRQSGFTGGAINAITKSGTNKLTGSAYGYYTDENLYGKYSQVNKKNQKLTDETDKTYGFTLGGPILKDKLFFFTSLEYSKKTYPATYYPGVDGYFLTTDLASQIISKYQSATGYGDTYNRRDVDTQSLGIMARLDWNINSRNKLSFRYQHNNSYKDAWSSGPTSYTFNGSSYRINDNTNSFVLELNSNISPKLYNEFRAGATLVRDDRDFDNNGPTIYIQGSQTVNLGAEYSSVGNVLDQDIWTVEDNLSWYLGNHTITFGTHNEFYNMKNGFCQYANGEFVYSGIDNFLADKATKYVWNYFDPEVTGSTGVWKTPFKAGQWGFYVQDKWDLSTRLQFTYGLRLDIPDYFNSPSTNTAFNATEYSKKYDAVIGRTPSSYVMASPRLGFRWFVTEDHSTLLRGGVGIFNGRAPFVWLENAWANTGLEKKGTTLKGSSTPSLDKYGKTSPADIIKACAATGGTASLPDINTVDKHFKFPQVFRANLALEQELPFGVKAILEALYSKDMNNIWYENYALKNSGAKAYAVGGVENSSTTYYTSDPGSYSSIINLTNTNCGYSYSFSAKLEKKFDFGLDVMASYTFGHSYSANDGTSSVALSNWKYLYCVDPNEVKVEKSMFDMPHRVLVTVSYNSPKYLNGLMQTHVGLSYNGNSGQRYSLTMADKSYDSFNGDSGQGNTLLYIPTADELSHMNFVDITNSKKVVTMSADDQRDAFENWIENDKYAKDHRGQYAERNSNCAPWENRIDFHLSQDFFYLKTRGSKVELTFDVYNVANMINKNWGKIYASAYNQTVLTCVNNTAAADGSQIGNFQYLGYGPKVSDISSRWHAQIGLRVTF